VKRPILEDDDSTSIMNASAAAKTARARALLYALSRMTRALEKLRYEIQTLVFLLDKEAQ
jgi:hypothetical protein